MKEGAYDYLTKPFKLDELRIVLEKALEELPLTSETRSRRLLAQAVEQAAEAELLRRKPDRPICANVEFNTAVLLEAIGLPRELFSPTFAVGRVGGWTAHVIEEQAKGRIIRPKAVYVGPR